MSIETTDSSAGLSEDAAEAALLESLGADPNDEDNAGNGDEDDDDDDQDSDDVGQDLSDDDDDDSGDADDDQDDDDQGGDEGDEGSEAPAAINDDQVVAIEINGESREFTVGSLKQLASREEAITARGQEAELVGGRAAATLQAALELAQEDIAPYANVDWLVLQNQLEPAEFEWHRQNAGKAQARYDKLVGAAQGFEQVVQERQQRETIRAAQECVQVLKDPKQGIPGWDDKLYGDILSFGVSQGLPQSDVAGITNPAVIKLLHKAMLFDRGQKVATTKVKQAPTKVIKGNTRTNGAATAVNSQKALKRLSNSGSDDDAVAALIGRWS